MFWKRTFQFYTGNTEMKENSHGNKDRYAPRRIQKVCVYKAQQGEPQRMRGHGLIAEGKAWAVSDGFTDIFSRKVTGRRNFMAAWIHRP